MTQVIADRYRLDERLALISGSDFYNGFDLQTQQRVIVRLIDLRHQDQKSLSLLEKRMAIEVRILQRIAPPKMLQTLDYGLQDTIYYQINEFVNFRTLRDEITLAPCDLKTALQYGRDLAEILAQTHKTGIIHGDLKPEAVLVTEHGFKLMDFYVANQVVRDSRLKEMPVYLSPEAIQGSWAISAACDVWSFGILLYELIAGSVPYPMPSEQEGQESTLKLLMSILVEPVPPLEERVPNLPPRLVSLMDGMLKKDAAKRISDMNAVTQELDAILSEFSMS